MDAQPRSEPGEAGAQPPSPEHERPRPRAVVLPNVLIPRQIICPMLARNQVIQVAMMSVRNGQYHIVRTGILVIDPEMAGARDPSLPVPVALPNAGSIAGVATVLPREMMQVTLPNVSPRHQVLLLELEKEEDRIFRLRRKIVALQRRRPSRRVDRAWIAARMSLDPEMGDHLPQALDYVAEASIFKPSRPNYAPYNTAVYRRRYRGGRLRRSYLIPSTDLPPPEFTDPVAVCARFLVRLRFSSFDRLPHLERAVDLTIQLLIDDVFSAKQFCKRLEKLFHVRPQPHLVLFLQANIHKLRQALYLKQVTLEGIDRPEFSVVFPIAVPTPEMPEYRPVVDGPPLPTQPIAAVEPRQILPFSRIPYDLPLPLSELHVSQVLKSGLPSLIKTELQEGDLHLYNPHVGYVHFRVTPTRNSFQIGNTTVRLVPPRARFSPYPHAPPFPNPFVQQ